MRKIGTPSRAETRGFAVVSAVDGMNVGPVAEAADPVSQGIVSGERIIVKSSCPLFSLATNNK